MTPTLQQRVRQVSRGAHRLVWIYALGWFVSVVCLAALVVGWFDYLVRFEDFGIRLTCCALLCLAAIWAFARFLLTACRYRCSDIQAARHIERHYPELGDRLTSAVAFAGAPAANAQMGSAELQRVVVAETEAVTAETDFGRCLDNRHSARALVVAALSLVTVAVLLLVDGPLVSLAAKRMFVPWEHHPWPRRHVLQWVQAPTRLAVGQDVELKLTDANGQPPDRVEVHYWFNGDDASQIQTFEMQPLGENLVHRLASVTRPFRYRATGGDDQTMPWTTLALVEPPRIIERIVTLRPPAYSGLESRQADGSFRALVETCATIHVRTSKLLSAALLETDTLGGHATIPMKMDQDQKGFHLDGSDSQWTILQSGEYGFRLIDQDGLDVGVAEQWNVQAIRDLPPTVSLRRPAADLLVTPMAQLPLEAIVKDDLAVRDVQLHFVRSASTDQKEEHFSLWTGPTEVVPESVRGALDGDEGVQRTVRHTWDFTRLSAMKPGEWIDFRVTAVDYKSQVGESVSRRFTFISSEELAERIAQRQSELLTEIAEIVRLQRETRVQTEGLRIQVLEASNLSQNDVDQLQSAELNQRQIQQRLGHPSDGVAAQIRTLIDWARSNRLDRPELMVRLQQFHDTIDRLNDDPLPDVQHRLIDAIKIVRESPLDGPEAQRRIDGNSREELISLFEALGSDQQRVVDKLEQLLAQLAQWDSYQRLAREVGRLKREQENVYSSTQRLRVETLSKDPNDFTAQQRAGLKRLTQQQNNIALRFGALTGGMQVAQQKLADGDPLAAATLADALDLIRQKGIGGQLRDVGRELSRNRLGQATDRQEAAISLLEQLQDVLANRREAQLDRRIDEFQDAVDKLDRIRARQEVVGKQVDESSSPTPSQFQEWADEEGDLAEQVDRVTRQIQRQGVGAAESALKAAGERLRGASKAAAEGDLPETKDEMKNAQQLLDDAHRQIKAALDASRESFQDALMTRLRQSVREFLSQQQRLMDETIQAQVQREQQDKRWTQTVQDLAVGQMALAQEVDQVEATLEHVVTFAFALGQVLQTMTSAGQYLESKDTGQETTRLQQEAIHQLQQILDAMTHEPPPKQTDDPPSQTPQPSRDEDQPEEDASYVLAQLKLIRAMQQQVNRETSQLEQVAQPWDVVIERRQKNLVQRQQRLAEIVQQLLSDGDPGQPAIVRPPAGRLDSLDRAIQRDEDDRGEDR